MNQAQKIKQWIDNGCKYDEGIKLYDIYGESNVLKDLFKKFKSRYYCEKLYTELITIKVNYEKSNIITPKEVKAKEVEFELLPDKLQRLDREKAKLFKSILQNRTEIKKMLKLKTNGRITMADALREMEQLDKFKRLKPFSVTYMSFNKKSNRGGQVLRFPSCYLRVINNTGSKIKRTGKLGTRQPSHWMNSTRNFEPIGSNEIKKLHIWLIFEFNGMEVVTSELG